MATKDQIQRLKAYNQLHSEVFSEWESRSCCFPPPQFPAFPQDLANLVCGAKTRSGTPCKQKATYDNGRCKFHGGPATGPTTEAGKEQARLNGMRGGRPRKQHGAETQAHEDPKITPRFSGSTAVEATSLVGAVLVMATDQPEINPEKPKPMNGSENTTLPVEILPVEMLKDVRVSEALHRCADCRNLSATWICQAAGRGEIDGGSEYLPVLSELRDCSAFKHWKT